MDLEDHKRVDFAPLLSSIDSEQVWELPSDHAVGCRDLADDVYEALLNPDDFPSLDSALVPGDHLAIAVDPNVPAVAQVLLGVTKAIGHTEAANIDIVLTEEATEETVESIREVIAPEVHIVIHRSSDRDALRFLGADSAADPIYLNRSLVDADFVLPIVIARSSADDQHEDLTGVFPNFADSASRIRASAILSAESLTPSDPPWRIGVQLIVSLSVDRCGCVSSVRAATPFSVQQRQQQLRENPRSFPDTPALIVASLDGDGQQQSWANAARAITTAMQHAAPDSTIVLWCEIDHLPAGRLMALASDDFDRFEMADSGDGFPVWDTTSEAARAIQSVTAEHRLMIHSQIDREIIESIGLGVIESADELKRLTQGFDSCGVIRGAQFYGQTRRPETRHESDD